MSRSRLGAGGKSCWPLETRKRVRDIVGRIMRRFLLLTSVQFNLPSHLLNANSYSGKSVSIQPYLMMKHLLTKYAADKGPGIPNLIFGTPYEERAE